MGKSAVEISVGFLLVKPTQRGGLRGGYLITSAYGRPIEFHYTGEILVPPPQRVLYGTRFEPAVYGETIGKALTDRQSRAPKLIAVTQPACMSLRRLIPAPMVCVGAATTPAPSGSVQVDAAEPVTTLPLTGGLTTRLSAPAAEGDDVAAEASAEPSVPTTPWPWEVATHPEFPQDAAAWQSLRTLLPLRFDWLEPFERLDLALSEIRDPMVDRAAA